MVRFTASEYVDMILAYGASGECGRSAARLYAQRFPGRRWHPTGSSILKCVQRARETGSVQPAKQHDAVPWKLHTRHEERVIRMFENNPEYSIRRVARLLNLPKGAVHRIWQEYELETLRAREEAEKDVEPFECVYLKGDDENEYEEEDMDDKPLIELLSRCK
ncbi:PREDICTED: uncharacterized protein LOC105564168 [Vollenhovia emeryi]|uniref:uncharacterized protein LOC105564168 n=1 Tax=Vollenhovia emeryi TaxID=411798 RepID=UPI0005F47601|nr:PREDICTED: uncharacterized protein LOC105564168 [Vollenhovia emeryi]